MLTLHLSPVSATPLCGAVLQGNMLAARNTASTKLLLTVPSQAGCDKWPNNAHPSFSRGWRPHLGCCHGEEAPHGQAARQQARPIRAVCQEAGRHKRDCIQNLHGRRQEVRRMAWDRLIPWLEGPVGDEMHGSIPCSPLSAARPHGL